MNLYDNLIYKSLNGSGGGGGSSDFSTAEVTVIVGASEVIKFSNLLTVQGVNGERYFTVDSEHTINSGASGEILRIPILDGYYEAEVSQLVGSIEITGEGSYNDGMFSATGDCTITVAGE